MASLDVSALLLPLDETFPCGPDLEHDDAFMALDRIAQGKPERQYGGVVIPAEQPDWSEVQQLGLALFERTRDLRVAVHLLRASVRLQGLGALHDGLSLIHGLLSMHWADVHPLLDAEDGNDPTQRLNALSPLAHFASVQADVRAAHVPGDRTGVNGRLLELASGKVRLERDETTPTAATLAEVLKRGEAVEPGLLAGLAALPDVAMRLDRLLDERVGKLSPDLKPLLQLMRALAETVRLATGGASGALSSTPTLESPTAGPLAGASGVVVAAGVVAATPGQIASRDDAVRALERVCEWIERNEPSNPAPLLIRRARRLIGKNFFDIIRDLAPDGLSQIEKIAGVSADASSES